MSSPLDLIDNADATGAVLTTFSLDLGFFDQWVLPLLTKAGIRNIVVIADESIVAEQVVYSQQSRAGRSYHLVSATCRGVFHPKVIFLQGPNGQQCCISSANLTAAGQLRNYETAAVLTSDDSEHRAPIQDVAVFLRRLLDDAPAPTLEAALSILQLEQIDLAPSPIRFVHNLDEPIAHQLPIGASKGIAPFLTTNAINQLNNTNPLDLYVHASTRESVDEARDARPSFQTIEFIDTEGGPATQRLHGKALWSNTGRWCLVGSPNITEPALYRSRKDGNIEAAILFEDHHAFQLPPHKIVETPPPSRAEEWSTDETTTAERPARMFTAVLDGTLYLTGIPSGTTVDTNTPTGWAELGVVDDGQLNPGSSKPTKLRAEVAGQFMYAVVLDLPSLRSRRRARSSTSAASVERLPIDIQGIRELEAVLGDFYILDELTEEERSNDNRSEGERQPKVVPPLSEWTPARSGDEPLVPDLYTRRFRGSPDALLAMIRHALRIDQTSTTTAAELSDDEEQDATSADIEATAEHRRQPISNADAVKRYRKSLLRSLHRGVRKVGDARTDDAPRHLYFQTILVYHERLTTSTVIVEAGEAAKLGYGQQGNADDVEIPLIESSLLIEPRFELLKAYAGTTEQADPMCRPTLMTHLAAAISDSNALSRTQRRQLDEIAYRYAEELLAEEDPTISQLSWLDPETCIDLLAPFSERTSWAGVQNHASDEGWLDDPELTTAPHPTLFGSAAFNGTAQSPAWAVLGYACVAAYQTVDPFCVIVRNDDDASRWALHLLELTPPEPEAKAPSKSSPYSAGTTRGISAPSRTSARTKRTNSSMPSGSAVYSKG